MSVRGIEPQPSSPQSKVLPPSQSVQWLLLEHPAQLFRIIASDGILVTTGFYHHVLRILSLRTPIARSIWLARLLAKIYRVRIRGRARVRVAHCLCIDGFCLLFQKLPVRHPSPVLFNPRGEKQESQKIEVSVVSHFEP